MRVAICWGGVSGYMAACWRELASRPGIDLLVLNQAGQQHNTAFAEEVTRGFNHRFLSEPTAAAYAAAIREHRAEVVSLSGWLHPAFLEVAADPQFSAVPFLIGIDTPLQRTWRQRLGRVRLRTYLRRMSRIVVPGERAWQYARYLGFAESQIRRGLYGIDYNALAPLHERRVREAGERRWPGRFLFVGRYVPEKGLDVLVAAYRRYRAGVSDPWPLTCCGMGPQRDLIAGEPGVEDAGFIQPDQMPDMFARHGALVLSSRFDPWPLVIAEASAAGLPVVCTEACGSAVELVRNEYSGFTAATEDAESLSRALVRAHESHAKLPEMGRRAQAFAAAYSAQAWADRWERILRELVP